MNDFGKTYRDLLDGALLKLWAERSQLVSAARESLSHELARRSLTHEADLIPEMWSLSEEQRYIAKLLFAVVKDEVSGNDAIALIERRAKYWEQSISRDAHIDVAYHTLRHFDDDSDIRSRDSNYDQAVRLALQKRADALLGAAQEHDSQT